MPAAVHGATATITNSILRARVLTFANSSKTIVQVLVSAVDLRTTAIRLPSAITACVDRLVSGCTRGKLMTNSSWPSTPRPMYSDLGILVSWLGENRSSSLQELSNGPGITVGEIVP
jgi:hypothetical protein